MLGFRALRLPGPGFSKRGVVFSPATLFTGGLAGAWYDPSDLSTLFKDTAATQPVTTHGDAVARINDKSGNANHVTQATAADRPLYNLASGKSSIYNSTGLKTIRSAALAANLTDPLSIAVAVIIDTAASARTAHNLFFAAFDADGASASHYVGQYFVDDKTFLHSGTDQSLGPVLSVATPYVVVATFNGAASTVRVNGASTTVAGSPGTRVIQTIILGALGTHGLLGKLYGAIVRDNVFSAGEITSIEPYLAGKVGASF